MVSRHHLLKNVLIDIEEGIRDGINADSLAKKHTLSSIHLQRLFKLAFKQSIGAYIRSRRLTASLESLLSTNSKLVNIALDYGFEYEQSYLRSFKREFGVTPGNIRKTWQPVKVTPPLEPQPSPPAGEGSPLDLHDPNLPILEGVNERNWV